MATAARGNDAQATSERTGASERRRFVAPPWLTPAVRVRGFTVIIATVAAILYLAIVRELPAARPLPVAGRRPQPPAAARGAPYPVAPCSRRLLPRRDECRRHPLHARAALVLPERVARRRVPVPVRTHRVRRL